MSKTLFISIDVEADGPIPIPYSMLSFGAAAFHLDHFTPTSDDAHLQNLGTFEANLELLHGGMQDPDTMKWWAKNQAAYDATRVDTQFPPEAMRKFREWVEKLAEEHESRPVLCGYPVTYDFMFIYWYLVRYTGFPAPFGFQGLCIKTLAADRMGVEFRQATKRRMPKHWFRGCPSHTHHALDDALGQGVLLMNILNDRVCRF